MIQVCPLTSGFASSRFQTSFLDRWKNNYHFYYVDMPGPVVPTHNSIRMRPRLDLSLDELFKLCLYSIYLSPSPTVVASVLNQRLKPVPRLTTKDVMVTYLHLHDCEHESWMRARDMNKLEKELLCNILAREGVEAELLNVDLIQPVGPVGCLASLDLRERVEDCIGQDG